MEKFKDIDAYIASFPPNVQTVLKMMRKTIQKAAPDATEAISYGMPTFKLKGNLVHFAAFKNHIGFYPAPSGIEALKKDLAPYIAGKGTVQFPLGEAIPYDLVERVVKVRVEQNLARK